MTSRPKTNFENSKLERKRKHIPDTEDKYNNGTKNVKSIEK